MGGSKKSGQASVARSDNSRVGAMPAQASVARSDNSRVGFMPAQASAELIIILGATLLVILSLTVLSSGMLSDIFSQRSYQDASQAVGGLASAADIVFSQGEGAWSVVAVTIPPSANLSPSVSFIGKPSGAPASSPSNTINIRVGGTDVSSTARETVVGSFPSTPGTYKLKVLSKGGYVTIGSYFFEVDKQSVFKSMARNEVREETLTFNSVGNEPVDIVVTSDWVDGGVSLVIGPDASFTINEGVPSELTLAFTSNGAAGGIYSSQLKVTATSQGNGATESISIPITIDVQV